ncbi:MAG: sugar ABC transporter permease [Acidobacteria bacterium]|nr:MAG: sugar ABC transporter permease [Acidobacteriota bacterium]
MSNLPMLRKTLWFIPSACLIGAVLIYPALRTFALSFYRTDLGTSFHAQFAGLGNFARLALDSRFASTLATTVLFTATTVSIEFAAGLVLALSADTWVRGRSAVRTILLIPWTLPTAVIAVLWAWIFNDQYGILNSLLMRTGILRSPISWLGNSTAAFWALVIADAWKTTPFVFVVLLAGMQGIPDELYEAMEIDGGGAWHKFRLITWPFLARFVFVALIFRVIQAFSVFDLVYVMTGGGPGGTTETLSVYAYQTMMRYLDFGYAATLATAMVLALALAALALYWLLLRRHEEVL